MNVSPASAIRTDITKTPRGLKWHKIANSNNGHYKSLFQKSENMTFLHTMYTEWPKKMYTLFTHQYIWNKFKRNFYFRVRV